MMCFHDFLHRRTTAKAVSASVVLLVLVAPVKSQDISSFEKRITVKALPNKLTVVVCERHNAPVFSAFTRVDIGADREIPGITGLAHMFEHMAFKGTDKIGTTNYEEEKHAIERVEASYQAFDQERHKKKLKRNEENVAALEKAWKDAMADAARYVVKNEFAEVIERNGGTGLNAFTDDDETGYYYSLPSNRLELWAYLESERFLHPVFRQFYEEREVVHEERRQQESRPFGRLLEQFLTAAYSVHPYRQPAVGWPSDLDTFSMTDAKRFFAEYYTPANMVITLVGDVNPSEAVSLAAKYFGRMPERPETEALRIVEPPQNSERIVVLHETSQPLFIEGYHKPDAYDKDDAVYDALEDLLSNGRTSRLYRSLVRDRRIASSCTGLNGFPGAKYPNLFVFYAVPLPTHTPEEIRDAIQKEIESLQAGDISDEELRNVKIREKANLLRKLADNEGLAFQLGTSQALYGDWRALFQRATRMEDVSKEDIQRVAQGVFVASNRTIAMIKSDRPVATLPSQKAASNESPHR